jgi:rhodanese-related sulfurtransferase
VIILRIVDPTLRIPQKIELPEEAENGIITADEAVRLSGTYQNVLLVDVRPPEQYAAGKIPNSINIPLNDIINNLIETDIANTENPIVILYCQKGVSSLKAYNVLKDAGYENVYNLGGIEDWPYEIVT